MYIYLNDVINFKIPLKMRLLVLSLFISIGVSMANNSYAQNARISIDAQNQTIANVLEAVEQQSDFSFIYDSRAVDTKRIVTVQANEKNIFDVLNQMFSGSDVAYTVINEKIILKKGEEMLKLVQQGITITGTVTDDAGAPIPGANVVVKGTTSGVISDLNGKFQITAPNSDAVLVFSFIGYVSQEVAVADRRVINVTLNEEVRQIDEVVVVGYGFQKKENLTGAVSVVNMDKVRGDRPVTTVANALQGAVPGLQITGGASPGESKRFNIRGITSINGTSNNENSLPGPLVLIDNVECQIDLINPEDIETITVLKDAASSAIYGARASFGVILITTKKAKKNAKMTFNYNNNFAFSKVINQLEPASVKDNIAAMVENNPTGGWQPNSMPFALWLEYVNEYQADPKAFIAKARANGEYFNEKWGMYTPKEGGGAGKYVYLQDNDPQNEIFDKFGFTQTHNISASGGSEKISYRLSLGYVDNDGPLKLDKDTYQRFNISSYVSADLTSWMNQAFDIRYSQGTRKDQISFFGDQIYRLNYNKFLPGADSYPVASDPEGPSYLNVSPLNFIIHGNADKTRNENPRIFSRTTFTPFKGFEGIFEYTFDEGVYDRNAYPNSVPARTDQMMADPYADPQFIRTKNTSRNTTLNVYGTYSLSLLEKHNFKLMAGFSQERHYWEMVTVSRKGAINTDLPSISGSIGDILSRDDYSDYTLRSGFFRFNYNYDSKYLLEVNGRYDGSSKFPTKNRFGFFPSVSAGWQVAREDFMNWSKGWLNELKLRASYGAIGNQQISNYEYWPGMDIVQRANWFYNGSRPTTLMPPPMVRDNFTWERAITTDFGADVSLLNNRFMASFDWYQRDTKNMLAYESEFPAVVGAAAPLQNVAELTTKGFELTVNWRDKIGKWGYSIGFNLYDSRTRVTKYLNEAKLFRNQNSTYNLPNRRYYVGQEFGEIWGLRFDRFYTIDDFEDTYKDPTPVWKLKEGVTTLKGNVPVRPGDIMWKNLDDQTGTNDINIGDDNLDNPGDRTIIGNETARYQFGINAGVNFMGFDLSVFLQGVGKRDSWMQGIVNASYPELIFPLSGGWNAMYQHQVGQYVQVKDAANGDYTIVNPDAYLPRIYNQPAADVNNWNRYVSDRYLLDASYLRVKNITLSYTFPQKLMSPIGINKLRIFVSAEDAITFTNLMKGVDPERISWGYPFYAVYSCGINLTF